MGYAVYIITNIRNGKQYVGVSKHLKRRWARHLRALGETPLLHKAINKYGKDSFVFTHFADAFDKEAAFDIEKMLIEQHNTMYPNGYNLTKGGECGVGAAKGSIVSEETKEKISKSLMGNPSPRKGVTLTDETKKKISESKKGKPSNRPGYKHSKETIEKIKAKKIARDLLRKVKETENV
jgi:group I intron endonuclease